MRGPGSSERERRKAACWCERGQKGTTGTDRVSFASTQQTSERARTDGEKSQRRRWRGTPQPADITSSPRRGARLRPMLSTHSLKQKLFFPLGAYRPMLSQVSIIYHRHICVGCSQLRKIERAAEREARALAINPWQCRRSECEQKRELVHAAVTLCCMPSL